MKYVRTKDGRIGKFYQDQSFTITCSLGCIDKKNIINQADTIEELLDELVVHNPSNDGHWFPKYFVYKNDWKNLLEPISDYKKSKGIEIYGAIWTDKGLIYVAKLNEKGELELLWVRV